MYPARFLWKALSAGLLLAAPLALQAQHPTLHTSEPTTSAPPTPAADADAKPAADAKPTTISVNANLVNLPVVVRDQHGALVQNLAKSDFALKVDGRAQTIRYFDHDTDLPLTLGLLVDTSRSVSKALDEERTAASAFLDEMLTTPKDQAFVVSFARQIVLMQDLTNSRPKLQSALHDLDTSSDSSGSSNDTDNSNGSNGGRNRAGTTLYDAVFLSSDEVMSKQQGRKALIILTDGEDRGSKETLATAIETAQRGDTILYAIYFKGEERSNGNFGQQRGGGYPRNGGGMGYPYPGGYPGGGYPGGGYPGGGYPGGGGRRGGGNPGGQSTSHTDGKKVLERMTKETGGRMFEVSHKDSITDIYKQIAEELRGQYRLGYTPDKESAGDGYHQVNLSFTDSSKDKKLVIQTRDGYYTGK